MDVKDFKILHELDEYTRITTSNLAKKVGISQQVAEYRIKKLQKKDIVYCFATVINPFALGYKPYLVLLRFEPTKELEKDGLLKYLMKNDHVYWSGIIGGKYDLMIYYLSKDFEELKKNLSELFDKYKETFEDYEIIPIVQLNQFKYAHLGEDVTFQYNCIKEIDKANLDLLDFKILHEIKTQARRNIVEISREIGIDFRTAKSRIDQMKQKGVIVGYKVYVRRQLLGFESYKVLISLKNYNMNEETKLISYLNSNPNIIYGHKLLGGVWSYSLGIDAKSFEELQQIILRLRANFKNIDEYEIFPVFRSINVDHLPVSKLLIKQLEKQKA